MENQCTHVNVIQHVDQMTSTQISGRQRWHVHLLVEPLLALARSYLTPGDAGQLPGLARQDLAATQVLYGLGQGCLGRLHGYLAAIAHRRRYSYALARYVTTAVQADPTQYRTTRHAGHADVLLYLEPCWLLVEIKRKQLNWRS